MSVHLHLQVAITIFISDQEVWSVCVPQHFLQLGLKIFYSWVHVSLSLRSLLLPLPLPSPGQLWLCRSPFPQAPAEPGWTPMLFLYLADLLLCFSVALSWAIILNMQLYFFVLFCLYSDGLYVVLSIILSSWILSNISLVYVLSSWDCLYHFNWITDWIALKTIILLWFTFNHEFRLENAYQICSGFNTSGLFGPNQSCFIQCAPGERL